MGPPSPFPRQWHYWSPWGSYRRHHTSQHCPCRSPPLCSHASVIDVQEEPAVVHTEEVPPDTSSNNNNSSSSPDEAIMFLLPTTIHNFTHIQDLFKRVASKLKITVEEVSETQHELTDILQHAASSKITLPINGAVMDLAKNIWQTPATIPPPARGQIENTMSPPRAQSFFSHIQHLTHL